ncbi:MAG: peptidyl-prolyl cis-trans isomerase [Actinobacteria bacterium]|nr:peptidyl-prolyl cis-trans isomerase [Actinomycetota bacterium]
MVTEEEVKQYYEDNKNTLFLVPARVKASHILAIFPWVEDNSEETEEGREEALEKIKVVEDKLKDGGDFEDLARQYSDDGTSGENGGDLGYISKGQMVEEFEEALFALDIEEVSGIVETEYGFHIIKATNREEEYIQKFDEVEEYINAYLLNLHKAEKWEDFIFSLIEEVNIEYFTDVEGTLNSTDTGAEDNTDIETEEESE